MEYQELTDSHKAQILRQRILEIEAGLYKAELNARDANAVGDTQALQAVANQQRTLGLQLVNARNELETLNPQPEPEEPKDEEPKPKRRTRKKPATA